MNLKELMSKIDGVNAANGWYDKPVSIPEHVALLHSEVSELFEAYRKNALTRPCDKAAKMTVLGVEPLSNIEEEAADIIIRALDLCSRYGLDPEMICLSKLAYNASRGHRHGGKIV
jgi:NTP pyrophosphatase (non-canonical NTP hydrolase)